jgi:antitoxin Phd
MAKMSRSRWSVHSAKSKLGTVVERARWGEPQVVFKDGKQAVIVLSAAEYDRLRAQSAPKTRRFVRSR